MRTAPSASCSSTVPSACAPCGVSGGARTSGPGGALNADAPKSVYSLPSVFKAGPRSARSPPPASRYKSSRAPAGSPPTAACPRSRAGAFPAASPSSSSSSLSSTPSSSPFPFKAARMRTMKLKERLVLGLSVSAVLFTLLLVVDLQMDLGMSGHHLVPSHARVRYRDQEVGAYNSFRRKFLQRSNNASREYNSGTQQSPLDHSSGGAAPTARVVHPAARHQYTVHGAHPQQHATQHEVVEFEALPTHEPHDDFSDLLDFMLNNNDLDRGGFVRLDSGDEAPHIRRKNGGALTDDSDNPTIADMLGTKPR
ncbi:extracellular serine/threonine protein CG31145 [Frankliniella occidentalis]|uniref:Extracellular serine/threonine protein CG31145 n=1 Tax=Frankliniella occidentalis TaxID=133901 RepID=A0A6J1RYV6_FRAOC|nr:extracellular serine/threonine protein CG31145 [Frankliniella occidentalis]XP_052121965.1 extracellular serine/threonine protein CG31145 [Frankliniella occidentalis]XP_052121966.1 extracellular serine/threonine protein CG31145 [Frankliniella occidentalis]